MRRLLLIAATAVVVAWAVLGPYSVQPGWVSRLAQYDASNTIIAKIEEFKQRQQRLPATLDEVGVSESDGAPAIGALRHPPTRYGSEQVSGSH